MPLKRRKPDPSKKAEVLAQAKRGRDQREKSYRERALKLFPHVCGRCGRDFPPQRLRELTVHHKDHDHDNNPPDGSNWELLCVYCHDNEHQDQMQRDGYSGDPLANSGPSLGFQAFEGLAGMIKPEEDRGKKEQ